MKTIEIYFDDLNQDTQKLYRSALQASINTSSPIAIIELEDDEEDDLDLDGDLEASDDGDEEEDEDA